jgi:hypothetical protein
MWLRRPELYSQPCRVTRELKVTGQIGKLINFGCEYCRFGDVLLAAADVVTGFGEEAALPGS